MICGDLPGVSRHARQRFFERYGRMAALSEWTAILAEILEQRARLIEATAGGQEKLAVNLNGKRLDLVWDPNSATIVTILSRATTHAVPRQQHLRMWGARA